MSAIYKDGTYYGTGGGGGSSYTAGEGINIENDEISVDTMTTEDLQDVKDAFTPNTSAPMRMFNYSTEEQIVGTWVDGKPIYQKSIECGTLPNATTKAVAHGISNLDKIIDIQGISIEPSSTKTTVPINFPSQTNNSVTAYTTATNIILGASGNRTIYTYTYVTLKYTKTTD